MNPFNIERTASNPYLLGDVFIRDDQEFTLMSPDVHCHGFFKENGTVRMTGYNHISELLDQGFTPVEEFIEKSKEMRENYIFVPRKLEDGTWAGLCPLVTTTAIHVDWDDLSPFESRYCFSHNRALPSYYTALYWLTRFKNKNSLPIGNCAYRGRLGNEPIMDDERTKQYYQDMYRIKYEVQFIDGLDIHGIANRTMLDIFSTK